MLLTLTRYGSTPYGVFGDITAGDQVFYTIEQIWNDNRKGQSCVPLGEYLLLWQPTTTNVPASYGGHTWYLEGDTVSALHESAKARTRCAFHVANTSADVRGCVGVGEVLTSLAGQWAVGRSRNAMERLLQEIGKGDHYLNIVQADCG
jgi:hypothetical protein